jgi:TatD DNase family protein
MNLPRPGDYIDIHTHGSKSAAGIFTVENLMAHESDLPESIPGVSYSFGIHPWFLNENNHKQLIRSVRAVAGNPHLIAIGETGFDKLRGPSSELQRKTFEEQVLLAEEFSKPVVVHCVRSWDELLSAFKNLKPKMPWLIHGFRGNKVLAAQLLTKGMYLSFWFDFVVRRESSDLLKYLPVDRIFLETDGADIDIRNIYRKVSGDLLFTVEELKATILNNFFVFFNSPQQWLQDSLPSV